MTTHSLKVAVIGGGTAGHIYPAIAIAEEFAKRGIDPLFIGSNDGMEAVLLPDSGWGLNTVHSRPFFGVGFAGKLAAGFILASTVWQCRKILQSHKIELVVGMGGHVSAAAIIAAQRLGITNVIHEANVHPGMANRFVHRGVNRCYVGFDEARQYFRKTDAVFTGTPVRNSICTLSNGPLPVAHDPSNPLNLLVLGGSLGSSFLNTHVPIVAAVIASLGIALEIHHQTGERDLNHTRDRYLALGLKPARVLPFISDMTGAYGNADFVISCAGASSLAEFAIAGLPCLLVPLASASENHQVANAEIFSHETGVPWVTEAQWKTVEIARLITLLVNAPTKWTNLSHQLRRQARTNSAALLVDDMLDLAIWRSSPAVSAP